MPTKVTFDKQLALLNDLALGDGLLPQKRDGKLYVGTQISGATLPLAKDGYGTIAEAIGKIGDTSDMMLKKDYDRGTLITPAIEQVDSARGLEDTQAYFIPKVADVDHPDFAEEIKGNVTTKAFININYEGTLLRTEVKLTQTEFTDGVKLQEATIIVNPTNTDDLAGSIMRRAFHPAQQWSNWIFIQVSTVPVAENSVFLIDDHIEAFVSGLEGIDKPVVTNDQGKLDATFLSVDNGLNIVDNFTPVDGDEYPNSTGYVNGDTWIIYLPYPQTTYEYLTGSLAGTIVKNGDGIMWADTWVHISTALAGLEHLRIDGTNNMEARLSLAGKYKVMGMIDGVYNMDGANVRQLKAKADLVHDHVIEDVDGLETALSGKAAILHTHAIYVKAGGDEMTGQLKGIAPLANEDLTRKDYVDGEFKSNIALGASGTRSSTNTRYRR